MSDDEFLDARLYITIRPALEYRIIEVGQHAVAKMVGDDDAKDVTFTNVTSGKCEGESMTSFSNMTDLDTLCSLCISVCSMTEEYLRSMEMEWIEFLTRIHTGLRNELRGIRKNIDNVWRVRERYKRIRNVQVNEEIANELNRLEEQVEEVLGRYRGVDAPHVRRSEELRSATVRLRSEFGAMYGRVPTKILTHVKLTFEGEMASIQEVISRSFDRRLKELMHRPI
tara:strand:- start:1094 stop:1771 length:678 start_codon:yes stop_codon:yes gene_type:complete